MSAFEAAAAGHLFRGTEAVPGYCVKCGGNSDVHVKALEPHVLENLTHRAVRDLAGGHPWVHSPVLAHMLLSLIAEVRDSREVRRG